MTVAASAPPPPPPTTASCTGTSGPLTLKASAVRAAGISPLLMFFDATGTTDSAITGNTTAFQDVAYTWNFGDANASGTGTWKYGSNAGRNSKNSATGGVAAHLYVTPGADTAYTVTVTANDGTHTTSCQLGVTAYDPAGANGFAGTKTACVSASGTPVAGSGGCPAGASVLKQSNAGSALSSLFASNKRVLFKCGDTFSGSYTIAAGSSTWSIGAYGGCENTQSGRPIFSSTGGNTLSLNSSNTTVGPIDGRISDIDFEGGGSGLVAVSTTSGFNVKQITLYNLYANRPAQRLLPLRGQPDRHRSKRHDRHDRSDRGVLELCGEQLPERQLRVQLRTRLLARVRRRPLQPPSSAMISMARASRAPAASSRRSACPPVDSA